MHVVWKRPDGFMNASPDHFDVVNVGDSARIWLHRVDRDNYPFRISGGWKESEATKRLNRLVNLLGRARMDWIEGLSETFHHQFSDDPNQFLEDTRVWLSDLTNHLKGDKWELEIMHVVIEEVLKNLDLIREEFVATASQ